MTGGLRAALLRVAVLLAGLLAPGLCAAEESNEPGTSVAAIPLTSYSSDTGLGLGLRGIVQQRAAGVEPYSLSLEAQAFATTGGVQFHFLFVDLPWLAGSPFRLDLLAGYYRNVAAPYYGIGNHPVPSADAPASFFSYFEETPLVRIRLRRALVGPLSAAWGYRFLLQSIGVAPRSLLALQSPLGVGGSRYGEASVELAWDTRDDEMEPAHGVLLEAAARATSPVLGSRYSSVGGFLSAAAYGEIAPGLVLAGRVALDSSRGDVPFDRLADFGSLIAPFFLVSGVGGGLTVRGLLQSEYIGHTKAVGNAELRWQFLRFDVCARDVRLSSVLFADAGRVWDGPDPPGLGNHGVHPGAGGGLRIAWGKLVLLRADAGYAEGNVRLYADFRHIF